MRFLLVLFLCCFSLSAEESPYLPMEDTRLNSASEYVLHKAFGSKELRSIEKRLKDLGKNEPTMAGLAAPQIGIFKRVVMVDMNVAKRRDNSDTPPNFQVFVNPQIIWKSVEVERDREACFSAGPFAAIIPRAKKVKVCAYTTSGELIVEDFEGYLARVFQHEIDHLDGIRFPDRLEKGEKLHVVTKEMYPAYREQWMDWNITADISEWIGVKNGKSFTVPLFDGPESIIADDQ